MSAIIMLDVRPANTKEIILIQHRIQDLTKLCGRIAENYQSYVIREVKHAHLVLNKYQIEHLSRTFHVHPQFIDQLIRICYINLVNSAVAVLSTIQTQTGSDFWPVGPNRLHARRPRQSQQPVPDLAL